MINNVSKITTNTTTSSNAMISSVNTTQQRKQQKENNKIITTTTSTIAKQSNCKKEIVNCRNENDVLDTATTNKAKPNTPTNIIHSLPPQPPTTTINKAEGMHSKMTNCHEVAPESCCCMSTSSLVHSQTQQQQEHNDDKSTSGSITQPTKQTPHCVRELPLRGELTSPPPPLLLTVNCSSLSLQNQTTATLRHKNIKNVPCEASYQRTLKTTTSTATERSKAHQCDPLELSYTKPEQQPQQQKDLADTKQIQSLAERKALLKKEFFKDFPSELNAKTTTLSKRLLKKQHNLKLKIPQQNKTLQNTSSSKTDSQTSSSLVALRILDLQSKLIELPAGTLETTKDFNPSFPSVKELTKKFDCSQKMIVPQIKRSTTEVSEMDSLKPDAMDQRHSPLSDEGCNLGQSPYSSDDDNDSIRTTHTAIECLPSKRKDKVARSASSDSALGLEVDETMDTTEPTAQQQQMRRMTLTVTDLPLRPALLPLAEPTLLPDSPTLDITSVFSTNQTQIPTKVLLEERVVEIPEDPRSGGSSRRESSASCFSDYPASDMQGVRFVRTPSVVVSDYSDDIMCGITLEEIEYFRAQRMRRRRSSLDTSGTEKDAHDNNSDVSAASSCSNLYYCGSTISALDGAECLVNGSRTQLERKTSDCSTCSASGDEDAVPSFTIPEQPEDCQDLSDMLANQHLTCKRSKKVGGITTSDLLTVDHINMP